MLLQVALALSGPMSASSLYEFTKKAFFAPERGVFCEVYDRSKAAPSGETCFNWSVGILHSALNAIAENDPAYRSELKGFLPIASSYFNGGGAVGGFDVLPGPRFPNDRYYDDNAWVALAFADSFRILGDKQCLTHAKEARDFAYSGWDSALGGGVYWKEREKTSKNTCSNGPTAAAILAIDAFEPSSQWQKRAEAIFRWTNQKLQDPADGLFWDNIALRGKIEKTKWSYNAALMLRTAKDLHRLQPSTTLGTYIKRLEEASAERWVREDGTIADELPFAHLLLENLETETLVKKCGSLQKMRTSLLSGSQDGFFGKRWGQPPVAGEPIKLIHQVSALRALAVLERRISQQTTSESNL